MCGKCGAQNLVTAKFCSYCGRNLHAKSTLEVLSNLTAKQSGLLLTALIAVFSIPYGMQYYTHWKRGEIKPTLPFKPSDAASSTGEAPLGHTSGTAGQADDAELASLRADAEKNPQDLVKLRALAAGFAERLRSNPSASPQLSFDAIDLLSRILKAVPDDAESLVMMADVSFDQRAFTKALEFYERYLKIEPEDAGARARYASTLTFLGRYDDSVKELDGILVKDPKNFPAMAYLAITYAQQGKIDRAKELGNNALAIAPSEDAKARFSAFVTSLNGAGKDDGAAAGSALPASNNLPKEKSPRGLPAANPLGLDVIINAIKNNPIAGRKYSRFDNSDPAVLKLYFKDFPMQAMPPFAKDKFFGGVREKAKLAAVTTLKQIVFLDADTGMEMDKIEL